MIQKKNQDISGYTRVTEVLSQFSGLDKVPKDILENAARRGTKVHNICEAIVTGIGDWGNDDETQGYVESFKQWWDLGHKVVAVEQRFYDEELMITGAVDLILEDHQGLHTIVDLKTSYKPSKTWPLQGSAYKYLATKSGYKVREILFIHLKKDGSKPDLLEYADNFDLYRSCLDIYNYFKETKRGRRKTNP